MSLAIREQVPLHTYTTLNVGGAADYLIEVCSVEELRAALTFARERTTAPPLILGGGSNVLVNDDGYRGVAIVIQLLDREYVSDDTNVLLRVGAGENLDEVIAETVNKGLWGLENLSAIPGTMGATPVQNVGAYGVEVSSLISEVQALHRETLEEKIFSSEDCQFGYRDSYFKTEAGRKWIITNVTFRLTTQARPILTYASLILLQDQDVTQHTIRETVMTIRAGKFPDWKEVGTAGSFFKNPIISQEQFAALLQTHKELPGYPAGDQVKVSLGYILDKICGLRGYCKNGVCLYEKQALVLTAEKGTTATDIKNFAAEISEKVFEKTSITIEPEVLFV